MTAAITDFSQFTGLRARAEQNDPAVLREAAGQFEALFIQTMLKNMRDTALADPIFGQSDQHEMYQDMMDKQLSLEMAAGRGIGLADMLVRQLGGEVSDLPTPPVGLASSPMAASGSAVPQWNSPSDFVRDIWPYARRAARKLNVAPVAILAQAALETGWGEHVMRRANGASSFNLFGIKADSRWPGDSVSKATLEYADGVAKRETARFRTYPDVGATFDDYIETIGNEARYQSVRGRGSDVGAFAEALQQSGYATDPLYAKKITNIAESSTMRDALNELKMDVAVPINERRAPGTD